VALRTIRRVLLLHYDPDTQLISMRHYEITARPVGMSKAVKQIITSKIPDLSKYNDISDFILRSADGYESEGDADGKVRLRYLNDNKNKS
jgi:ribosome biogenesis protein SSF1/2